MHVPAITIPAAPVTLDAARDMLAAAGARDASDAFHLARTMLRHGRLSLAAAAFCRAFVRES